MSDENLHTLTNSFLAVRLLALRELPSEADQGAGPFLVVQRGFPPDEVVPEPVDFVLTRRGTWLPVEAFVGLAWDAGRDLAVFPSAAEVMLLLEDLPPRPAIERERPGGAEVEAESGDDAFFAAVLRAVRGE